MRVEKYKKHRVELFDSIDEMPIQRFQKYNKYMLIDSGVGSDLQDILDHIEKIKIYIKANPKMATVELDNMRQALFFAHEELSPKYMAFAVLVKSIDGNPTDDLSDIGLKRVLKTLNEAKKGWLDGILNSVKKKIDRELNLYFPGKFESVVEKEYYDELKSHTLLKLDHIITGADVRSRCKQIETKLAMLMRPQLFSGKKSAEISYDKQFEEMCLVLSHNLNVDTRGMNVLQFYNAFEYLKKQAGKQRIKAK